MSDLSQRATSEHRHQWVIVGSCRGIPIYRCSVCGREWSNENTRPADA